LGVTALQIKNEIFLQKGYMKRCIVNATFI
jgi:hypothetical protein